jgi:hypothetical protein
MGRNYKQLSIEERTMCWCGAVIDPRGQKCVTHLSRNKSLCTQLVITFLVV